ncbi:RNA-guided endonuclease TnpB family protein [Desulfurobacterium crinifex]
MSAEVVTLTYDVTLPKFLWKYLHKLFETGKIEVNQIIRNLWNEEGFSLLKQKGEASAILKRKINRPDNLPSRVFRNVLECAGRIIRSQIERKETFEELVEYFVKEDFNVRKYVKDTGKNLLLVENILRQIENLRKRGKLPESYFQLPVPDFKGEVFLTSADDSIGKGQFKKLKVGKENIELEIKLPVSGRKWKWFKTKVKTPEKIKEALSEGEVKAPLLKRVKNKNNRYVYVLSIPIEFKIEKETGLEEKVLGIDLSPSISRLAVGIIKEGKKKSRPIYFKAERLVKKILRIRKEVSCLERKIDNIRNQIEETKSRKHKERLKNRLKHLFAEQKLRQKKLKNIRKQILEVLTKEITEIAKLTGTSLVAIEKLEFKDIPEWKDKTLRWLFSSWFYSKFSERLEQKLKLSGIRLRRVNPAYTSKKCHVCGSKLKGEGLYLVCENCKKVWDRDYNASINIAERGLRILKKIKEKLINKLSRLQKERKPKGLVPKGVREITVPPDSLLRAWSEVVEVSCSALQPHKEAVSSVKKNGTEMILQSLRRYKSLLENKYGVSKLGIFGSVARGDIKETSDVDVVIEIRNADPFVLLDIKEELTKLLGCKVDLIRLRENMNRFLKKRIEKEAIYV